MTATVDLVLSADDREDTSRFTWRPLSIWSLKRLRRSYAAHLGTTFRYMREHLSAKFLLNG